MCYLYQVEYYSVTREKEILPFETTYAKWSKLDREGQILYLPYFLDYKTHQTIRCTQVLEEENGGQGEPRSSTAPPPVSQVSYIRTIRCTPIFLPNLGGGTSYSPKNTVNTFQK